MSDILQTENHDYKAEYLELFDKYVNRPGKDRLLDWMSKTDFLQLRQAQSTTVLVHRVL